MIHDLSGVFTPVATPFDSDGELVVGWFNENLERLVTAGIAGFLVSGSQGESPYLSDDEKFLLVNSARKRIPDIRTLIVGAGKESTYHCIRFIRKVADLGADMVLVGTPSYFKPAMNDDALFAYFWTVADESPIPIIVYNIPQYTGVGTSANLIARLSAHENIAGIKESSANIVLQAEVRRRTPERFKIVVGSAPAMLSSFIVGACGAIVAIANVLPAESIEVYETFRSGDWQKAAVLQDRLCLPAAAVTTGFGVPGLKLAMELVGFHGGYARLPLLPLNEEQKAALTTIFKNFTTAAREIPQEVKG